MTTVAELIHQLQTVDPSRQIVVWHYGKAGDNLTLTVEDGRVTISDDGDCG